MTLYAEKKLLYNGYDMTMGGVAVNCMKCGREMKEDAVFCEECLEHMERYPVPEHTLVYVPSEKDRAATKKHTTTHTVVSAEEQAKRFKREADMLRLLVILFALLSMFLGVVSMETLNELKLTGLIGKNYTPVVATETVD